MPRIDGLGEVNHPLTAPDLPLDVEISRYLSAVDAFREEGCDIQWIDHSRPGVDLVDRLDYYSIRVDRCA